MPQRSSDLVETYAARALGTGVLGLVFLVLSGVMWSYRGDSGGALAIVLGVIALGLLGYAAFSLAQTRKVGAHKLDCPMCGATNSFEAPPTSDVICRACHRTIPMENGQILPLKQVSCNSCHESNWYSDRTKSLLCEACGREILIARPDGSMGHSAYAVSDDARPYELVLVAFDHASEELVGALQRSLGANRTQVRALLTDLPSVLLTNVPRQKAEMLRTELSHHGAAVEARPL